MKDLISKRRRLGSAGEKHVSLRRAAGDSRGAGSRRVSPTVSTAAIAEAQNALEAAQASGDYRHQSVADLLRAALAAYVDGLTLTQQARSGRTKRHTVELSEKLFEQYAKLPSRSRGLIIERALLSFLARGLGS